jgi:hypothetical protein
MTGQGRREVSLFPQDRRSSTRDRVLEAGLVLKMQVKYRRDLLLQ